MKENWKIFDEQDAVSDESLSDFVGSKFLAKLLINRKINTCEKAKKFFQKNNFEFISPKAYKDMQKAVLRIKEAIDKKEKIIIYGDFDADGVCSTCVFIKTLEFFGANFDYYIPSRIEESHGLNTKALVKLISKKQAKLIITCDCGISNVNEAKFIKNFNVDLIITDHHSVSDEVPEAFAIINAKVPDALDENLKVEEIEALTQMAGVGVAFKVCTALSDLFGKFEQLQNELMPIVATGTIADVVPLLNENRKFVVSGLKQIKNNKGLAFALKNSNVENLQNVTSETIAFNIVPKINAEGRLSKCENAIKLLTSNDEEEIKMAFENLSKLNIQRQELCNQTLNEVISKLKHEKLKSNDAIILYEPNWHIGVVGIVANKVVEKFSRPCFLMSDDPSGNLIRCSARSFSNVDLHKVVEMQKEFLEFFGGHTGAAGFSFKKDKISFEKMKNNINQTLNLLMQEEKFSRDILIDAKLEGSELNFSLIDSINLLEPFGEGVKNPLFMTDNLKIKEKRLIGKNNSHLKLILENPNSETFEAVFWSAQSVDLRQDDICDFVYSLKINEFNDEKKLQLDIFDFDLINRKIDEEISKQHEYSEEDTSEKNADLKKQKIRLYDHRKKENIILKVFEYVKNLQEDVGIFVEDRRILNFLIENGFNSSWFINRENFKKIKHLFLFDYPCCEEIFLNLCKLSQFSYLHLMKPEFGFDIDYQSFVKQLFGMLNYALKKKNATVNLQQLASALAISEKTLKVFINSFENLRVLKIFENDKKTFHFKIEKTCNILQVVKSEDAKAMQNALKDVSEYKKHLFENIAKNFLCI